MAAREKARDVAAKMQRTKMTILPEATMVVVARGAIMAKGSSSLENGNFRK